MIAKIFVFYIFIIILPFFAPVSVSFYYFITGQTLTVLIFIIFYLGWVGAKKFKSQNSAEDLNQALISKLRALCIICPFLAVFSVKFYTGSGPIEVFGRLGDGVSNYIAYQIFFQENILPTNAYERVLGIASLAIVKFTIISYALSLKYTQEVSRKKYLFLAIAAGSYFYISLGRGTSKEIFELVMLYIFISNASTGAAFKKKNLPSFILTLTVIFVALGIFYNNIGLRGDVGCITSEVCYEENFLSKALGGFSDLTYLLFAYFSFGIFYTHFAISAITQDLTTLIAFLIPFGPIYLMDAGDFNEIVCQKIDCGVAWPPKVIDLVSIYGFIFTMFMIALLGMLARILIKGLWGDSIMFVIFLFMISLPFGDIVFLASSTLISLALFIFLYILRYGKLGKLCKIKHHEGLA